MSEHDPIELDCFYKRLSYLVGLSDLNPAAKIVFLSAFENWYYFQSYKLYSSIAQASICYFEEIVDA